MVAPTPYKPTKEATSPASAEFRNTLKAWEIEPRTVTEYWPQANGLVERFNKVPLKFIQTLLAKERSGMNSSQRCFETIALRHISPQERHQHYP